VYARNVQASEKVYMDLRLEVHNPGGHSSLPVKDNAIYRLAAALDRIGAYDFPPRLNEVTRAYFTRAALAQPDTIAARMRMVGESGDTAAMRRLTSCRSMIERDAPSRQSTAASLAQSHPACNRG